MGKDNSKEIKDSLILGASYDDQTYTSDEPNVIALHIFESSEYNNLTVNKSGSSEVVESLSDHTNTAVYIMDSDVTFKDSTIGSNGDNSQALYCDSYSNVLVTDGTEINTDGDNNAAVVTRLYANVEVVESAISTFGTNSPAFYCANHPGKITVKESNIQSESEYTFLSDHNGYSILLDHSAIFSNEYIGKFTEAGEFVATNNVNIEGPKGLTFELEGNRANSNIIVRLENNNINVSDELLNIENSSFYVSIKQNALAENNTLISVTNSEGNIILREQDATGDIIIDKDSVVRININNDSVFIGAIPKPEGEFEGNRIRLNLNRAVWNLSGDSYLTELVIDDSSRINLNGHVLTVGEITSEYDVGHIVNYRSSDGLISQDNLVVIKVNEDGTYNLYDTDDKITYNDVTTEEMVFTARILDNIDTILQDIDTRARNSQSSDELIDGITVITVGDSDTNGIKIDNEVANHTDITVIKNGDSTVDPATILNTIDNAAILVENKGEFSYHSSSVTTNGQYAPGLVVSGEDSVLETISIEVLTSGPNSVGILSMDQGTFSGTNLTIETNGLDSHGVYVDNGNLSLSNSTIETSGSGAMGVIVLTTSDNVSLEGVEIESTEDNLYVSDSSTLDVINCTLNNTSTVTENSTLNIRNSTITTNNEIAYNISGSGTINNTNNTISVGDSYAVVIDAEDGATLVLSNDIITNTGDFSSIYVVDSAADITIDNTVFNTEDIMLRIADMSVVNLIIAGDVTGDIVVGANSVLNVTITGSYTGLINNSGISGTVNVTIDGGTWTLTTAKDSYVYSLTITDNDNTRVVYNGTSRLFVNDESFINTNDETIDIDSGYSTKLYPTQRILKVCKSEDLPAKPDRQRNYMYLVYDKMELHVYQSKYTDPFCIVETLPENKSLMTDKMIYITFDGYVYCYSSYRAIQLGTVENFDPEQLSILAKCGITYFMNAESRYIDKQKRTIQLPFQNGNYQLNLSLFEDIMIDEDTVIRFDPETEQFYVAGKEYQFDNKLNNIGKYSGGSTHTAINRIDHHTFRTDVRVSDRYDNEIKVLNNGLYISKSDLAKLEDYDRMILAFAKYKHIIDGYIYELRALVDEASDTVSEASVNQKIHEALVSYQSNIEDMFNNYESMSNRLDEITNILTTGLDESLENAKNEIEEYINQTNNAWEHLTAEDTPIAYSDSFIELRALALNEIRSQFSTLREIEDEEDDPIHSEGIIPDAETAISGLSLDETSVQNYIINSMENIYNEMGEWEIVDDYNNLPEIGDPYIRYFVINLEDEEHPVYQEYKWVLDEYDIESGEITTPAHYELVYDMNA